MPERTWTILDIIQWSEEFFRKHLVESARLDAEILLAHVLEVQRIQLYTQFDRPLSKDELTRFRAAVIRRARDREPVAYITGTRGFWSHDLKVTPAVLIPRPETEHLVEIAVAWLREAAIDTPRVVDIGTGSGAIAIAIAAEVPGARVLATDLSQAALDVANVNIADAGLADRLHVAHGDLLAAVPAPFRPIDLLVSNPPYVSHELASTLAPELRHEPPAALFAERRGMATIERLVQESVTALRPRGALMMEIGFDQGDLVRSLLAAAGYVEVQIHPDFAGHDRVVTAVRACASLP